MKLVSNVVSEKQLREAQLRALKLFANTIQGTYGPMGGYTAYSYRDGAKGSKAIMSNYTKDGFTVLKNIDLDALSKSFEGLQKILDLVSTFVVKEQPKTQNRQWYDD